MWKGNESINPVKIMYNRPMTEKETIMLAFEAKMPPSLLQADQANWAFAHFSAENIGLLPSTERD